MDGKATFSVPMKRLTDLDKGTKNPILYFEANVTEDLTKYKQTDEQSLSFYQQPIKLEIPEYLPDTFKPGMVYDAVVS